MIRICLGQTVAVAFVAVAGGRDWPCGLGGITSPGGGLMVGGK